MSNFPGPQPSVVRETSGMAVAALALGIAGFIIPLSGLIGIILGAIALARISAASDRWSGKGLAIAGIVTGAVSLLAMTCLMAALLLPALGKARQSARDVVSMSNLRQIGVALHSYATENADWMPEPGSNWASRLAPYGVTPNETISPRDKLPYVYLPPGKLVQLARPSETVIAHEDPANAPGQVYVLFADGRVERLTTSQLEVLLRAQRPKAEGPER